MALEFRFPDVGEGITEGTLIKWLVKEGEKVKTDQALAEVETDKAIVELPSPGNGTILKLFAKTGEKIKVGQVLVSIGEAGENVSAPTPVAIPVEKKAPEKPVPVQSVSTAAADFASVLAMPHTRKLARMLGVDIALVHGSGPGGRITDDDVKRYKEGKEIPAVSFSPVKAGGRTEEGTHGREERIPFAGMRKAIAENVSRSFHTAVPVTVMEEVAVDALWQLRQRENEKLKEHNVHLTFLPFVIKACLVALQKFPYFNASIDEEKNEIVLKHFFHIGIAVDTEEGLMVPVIRNANEKSIVQLALEIAEYAKEARERKIKLDDLKGSSFSITNYGSVGGKWGTPIINYPNVAVLGLGHIAEKPVVVEGKVVVRKMFPLSLTFDHRIVDGAQASQFLSQIMKHLEDPGLLLVDNA